MARTNNSSEGWHNRFQVVVGRCHPSLYNFLNELQHEQGDTESMIRQLNLGQKIKNPTSARRRNFEERIFNIVQRHQEYVENDTIIDYLKAIGYYLHF